MITIPMCPDCRRMPFPHMQKTIMSGEGGFGRDQPAWLCLNPACKENAQDIKPVWVEVPHLDPDLQKLKEGIQNEQKDKALPGTGDSSGLGGRESSATP